jgi:hypothetical protein
MTDGIITAMSTGVRLAIGAAPMVETVEDLMPSRMAAPKV